MKLTRKLTYANRAAPNMIEVFLQDNDSSDQAVCQIACEFGENAFTIIRAASDLFRRCLLKNVSNIKTWKISRESSGKPDAYELACLEKFEPAIGNYLLFDTQQYAVVSITSFSPNE